MHSGVFMAVSNVLSSFFSSGITVTSTKTARQQQADDNAFQNIMQNGGAGQAGFVEIFTDPLDFSQGSEVSPADIDPKTGNLTPEAALARLDDGRRSSIVIRYNSTGNGVKEFRSLTEGTPLSELTANTTDHDSLIKKVADYFATIQSQMMGDKNSNSNLSITYYPGADSRNGAVTLADIKHDAGGKVTSKMGTVGKMSSSETASGATSQQGLDVKELNALLNLLSGNA
jgi:hypothetical protein